MVLVWECHTSYATVLVWECHTYAIVLVWECHTFYTTVLVWECHTFYATVLVWKCHTSYTYSSCVECHPYATVLVWGMPQFLGGGGGTQGNTTKPDTCVGQTAEIGVRDLGWMRVALK